MGCVAAALTLTLAMSGCGGSSRAIIPSSYDTFNSTKTAFQIQYPAGWKAKGGGGSGYVWAEFTSGSAKISVAANSVGSLIGDIANAQQQTAGATTTNDPKLKPVAQLHEGAKGCVDGVKNIREDEAVLLQSGLGDAWKSEFTGKKTFGGKVHGYRATTMSVNHQICVNCECSESQWDELKPVFDKVIQSVSLGQ
jgi:hypothetical protein